MKNFTFTKLNNNSKIYKKKFLGVLVRLMEINNIKQNNLNLSFKAGLTRSMVADIKSCNIKRIASKFDQFGVETNFNNNKFVAWCSLKCFEIIQKLNLGIPRAIFVEDFNKLNIIEQGALGFTNFAPTKLYLNNDSITQEKTIFFNKLNWENIDEISDENFKFGITTTDFFLETFLHEFAHVIHENNLLDKKNGSNVIAFLQKMLNPKFIETFQIKYANILKSICNYASENPLETVACDLSKRILNNIDKSTLKPRNNFIHSSPYQNFSIIKKINI